MRYRPQEQNGFDPQGAPPFGFDGVGMRNLLFKAEAAALQRLCEENLTSVARQFGKTYSWRPLTSINNSGLVMLSIVTYDRMYSGDHPDLGSTSQAECVLSIPVVKWNALGLPVEISFYTPYCFVTDGWSIITGRCVLGYPKVNSWLELPDVDPNRVPPYPSPGSTPPYPIRVSAKVLERLGPTQRAGRAVVVDIPDPGVSPDYPRIPLGEKKHEAWPFGPVEGLYGEDCGEFRIQDEDVLALLLKWAGLGAPQLALKQFRDPDSTGAACYQALVDFHVLFERFDAAGLSRLVDVYLYDYASLAMAKRLGLDSHPVPGSQGVYLIKPFFAYWYRGDFSLKDDAAKVLGGCGSVELTPPSCPQILARARKTVIDGAAEQVQQWCRAGNEALQGSYGLSECRRDLRATVERSMRSGRELSELSWQAFEHAVRTGWSGLLGERDSD